MTIQIYLADLRTSFDAQAMLDTLSAYHASPMGNNAPLPDDVRETVIDGLLSCSNHRVFLALDVDAASGESKQVVGMAVCFVNYSTFRARPLINVHDLAILPEYQGRGIGRRLLEYVIAYASENQFVSVTLEVRRDNIHALKLYQKLGFKGIEEDATDEAMLFGKLTLR